MVGAFWPSNLGIGTSAAKIMGVQAPKRGKNMEKYPHPVASISRRLSVFFPFQPPMAGAASLLIDKPMGKGHLEDSAYKRWILRNGTGTKQTIPG
jgi:hypothetical protein